MNGVGILRSVLSVSSMVCFMRRFTGFLVGLICYLRFDVGLVRASVLQAAGVSVSSFLLLCSVIPPTCQAQFFPFLAVSGSAMWQNLGTFYVYLEGSSFYHYFGV